MIEIVLNKFAMFLYVKFSDYFNQKVFYIHIGSHKTGTTSIQHFFRNNQKFLETEGFFYPILDSSLIGKYVHKSLIQLCKTAHHQLAWDISKKMIKDDFINSYTYSLFNEIMMSGYKNIIISSEAFSLFNETEIERLKRLIIDFFGVETKINIIYYCRRQDQYFQSLFLESLKHRETPNIDEFYQKNSHRLDHYETLKPWRDQFGENNIIVRCYEKKQFKDSLIDDMLFCLNIKSKGYNQLNEEWNKSIMSSEFIGILRHLTTLPSYGEKSFRQFWLREFSNISSQKKTFSSHSLLSPRKRIEIIEEYSNSNEKVAKEYLHRSDGVLFFDPLPDISEKWTPIKELDVENLFLLCTSVIYNLNIKIKTEMKEMELKNQKRQMLFSKLFTSNSKDCIYNSTETPLHEIILHVNKGVKIVKMMIRILFWFLTKKNPQSF